MQTGPIEDHRGELARLRRPVLSAILKMNNVPHTPDDPATIMRDLIAAKGIRFEGFDYATFQAERLFNQVERTVTKVEEPNYSDWPIYKLKQLVKERGLKSKNTDKKADLIEKLSG
jgi:hypothetical protein